MEALLLYASDEEEEKDKRNTLKRKRKRSSDSSSIEELEEDDEDDEELPQWVRSFPHVDGNWPSHVFLTIDSQQFLQLCTNVLHFSEMLLKESNVKLFPFGSDKKEKDFFRKHHHVSLSRPFVLRRDQIESFVQDLRIALKWRKRYTI